MLCHNPAAFRADRRANFSAAVAASLASLAAASAASSTSTSVASGSEGNYNHDRGIRGYELGVWVAGVAGV